jgi:hypothetical protein
MEIPISDIWRRLEQVEMPWQDMHQEEPGVNTVTAEHQEYTTNWLKHLDKMEDKCVPKMF